jgi:hypothetical protein
MFGPAVSSPAYQFALWYSGAHEGSYGWYAYPYDPVSTLIGGNMTGGWKLPFLTPLRIVGSLGYVPLLPFPSLSSHSNYP